MSRYPFAVWLVSAVATSAQPASVVKTESAAPPATVPAALPARPRAISAATADLLKSSLPKITLPKPAEKKPEAESPVLRETDQPQNEIVRLPSYIVREERSPI